MRIAAVIGAAAVVALGLVSCSAEEKDNAQNRVDAAVTSGQQAIASATSAAGSALESGKIALFVATFRGGFSSLAEDRSDADIEQILTTTCAEVASGSDADAVASKIEDLAANKGVAPTADQAKYIYQLARGTCP
ncbi:hypothetical protein [Rhodococcus sp. 27YEA15]|uniref:hypothetical protein n=1 Tax=Rhodococcus sp. 27YEA15 TaxID=3156259 RepID=UPI003C7C52D4